MIATHVHRVPLCIFKEKYFPIKTLLASLLQDKMFMHSVCAILWRLITWLSQPQKPFIHLSTHLNEWHQLTIRVSKHAFSVQVLSWTSILKELGCCIKDWQGEAGVADNIHVKCMSLVWWMWKATVVHAFECVIKNREKCMHNGHSSYLPTGRAGDRTMVWMSATHNTEKNRSRTEGQEKKEEIKIRDEWGDVGLPTMRFRVEKGGVQSPKQVMAWAWRRGHHPTAGERPGPITTGQTFMCNPLLSSQHIRTVWIRVSSHQWSFTGINDSIKA